MTSRSVGFDLRKRCSFWPVLNIACELSVSWSIFCLFCYRHKKFWHKTELQRTLFLVLPFVSYHYSIFFQLNRMDSLHYDGGGFFCLSVCWWFFVCGLVFFFVVFGSFFFFLDLFTSFCIERSVLTWSFKAEDNKHLWSNMYRKLCLFSSSCCHLTTQSNQQYITSTLEEIKSMELIAKDYFLQSSSSHIQDIA